MLDVPYVAAMWVAGAVAVPAVVIVWLRRERLGALSLALLGLAIAALVLAAGGLRVVTGDEDTVLVLVDESASTRGAEYRDEVRLKERVEQILGNGDYEVGRFDARPPEITRPTLLFSDGRFRERPSLAAPVYPVIDAGLLSARDARVVEIREERGEAVAVVEEGGARKRVLLGSAYEPQEYRVSGMDLWPENDELASDVVARPQANRWSVSRHLPSGFTPLSPAKLPESAKGYVSTAMLILDANVAGELADQQQVAIVQWVRELGGTLLLVGDTPEWIRLRGSAVEEISPLAVDPPEGEREWIVLLDTSGSMSAKIDGKRRWEHGLSAARRAIRALPPRDSVRFGTFAEGVRWWASGLAGEIVVALPSEFASRGPTNLDAVMEAVAELPEASGRQLLLLTDAEVEPKRSVPEGTRLHCMALAPGRGVNALMAMCEMTGGRFTVEPPIHGWAEAAEELARVAGPWRWMRRSAKALVGTPLPPMRIDVTGWNRAFLRDGSDILAKAETEDAILAATWRVGLGRVMTTMTAAPGLLDAAALTFAQAPADERYSVTWEPRTVRVNAGGEVGDSGVAVYVGGQRQPVGEVAAGVYEADLPPAGGMVVIAAAGEAIARRVLAPRYAPEFAAIGIDRKALEQLASQSGGTVVEAGERNVAIGSKPRFISLSLPLALAACAALAASVILLRRRL